MSQNFNRHGYDLTPHGTITVETPKGPGRPGKTETIGIWQANGFTILSDYMMRFRNAALAECGEMGDLACLAFIGKLASLDRDDLGNLL